MASRRVPVRGQLRGRLLNSLILGILCERFILGKQSFMGEVAALLLCGGLRRKSNCVPAWLLHLELARAIISSERSLF